MRPAWLPPDRATAAESLTISVSNSSPSRLARIAMPWSPIGPLKITRSPGRAWLADKRTPSGTIPIPVVLMNRPSPFPFSTTFVSPVTIATPAAAAACAMEAAMRCSLPSEALFENESGAEKQWPRAAHRQIVHRAVNRQRPDIAAGKEQRLDHEGVGGEGHPRPSDVENRLIVQPVENGVRKQRQKDIAQQFRAEPPSAAVAEHDPLRGFKRSGAGEQTRDHCRC